MTVENILNEIHKGGYEYQVYDYLSKYMIKENTRLEKQISEYKATIRAIKNINRSKNEAIDNLCEVEE